MALWFNRIVSFVIWLGFEPKTDSLEGCCSIQLSYQTPLICAGKGSNKKENSKKKSEWISYGKVECKVIPVVNMFDPPAFFAGQRWIKDLHTKIKTQQKVVKVKTQSYSHAGGHLFVKRIK